MHYTLTIMVEPEYSERILERAKELAMPFDENLEVEPYEGPCWECAGNARYQPCAECKNTGRMMRTDNHDKGTHDYFIPIDMERPEPRLSTSFAGSRWDGRLKPGEPTFAVLLPGEGWHDRDSFNEGMGRETPMPPESDEDAPYPDPDWAALYTRLYEQYIANGYIPLYCDYHI